jgi:endonuclease/exonuclease/phosphatase family metal-dependent hydrolase
MKANRSRYSSVAALAALLLLILLVHLLEQVPKHPSSPPSSIPAALPAGAEGYLFCFWNTENLFDDQLDGWKREPDKDYDSWFAADERARKQKYSNLSRVVMGLNGGRGPDILAIAEAESERSAQLLAEAMNEQLQDPALRYQEVVFKNPHGGRNIANAVITRLPVVAGKTRLLGHRLRMLQVALTVNGKELVVLATHWTSRVSDEKGAGRARYADQIYGAFKAMYLANPDVAVLICGDFNDNPDDPSVRDHLHAVSDEAMVKAGGAEPLLLNLFGKRWEESQKEGSHYYHGRWYIFDQIVVSPGLLGPGGWQCEVQTAEIVHTGEKLLDRRGRPLRFGSEKEKVALSERGCSDHLPVTVRLRVAAER